MNYQILLLIGVMVNVDARYLGVEYEVNMKTCYYDSTPINKTMHLLLKVTHVPQLTVDVELNVDRDGVGIDEQPFLTLFHVEPSIYHEYFFTNIYSERIRICCNVTGPSNPSKSQIIMWRIEQVDENGNQ